MRSKNIIQIEDKSPAFIDSDNMGTNLSLSDQFKACKQLLTSSSHNFNFDLVDIKFSKYFLIILSHQTI